MKEDEARLSLEGAMPQKSGQLELPFMSRGEASREGRSVEASPAEQGSGHPGSNLMELALTRPNLKAALKRVRKNKGGPGIDGMRTEELLPYLWRNWDAIRGQLLAGLRFPTEAQRSRRGTSREALRGGRPPCCGGRGPEEVLRPGQPRRADG